MIKNNFPKVLTISNNSFSNSINLGKSLESFFVDFPKENRAQIFFSKTDFPDFDFCSKYFRITDFQVLYNFIFFWNKKNGKIKLVQSVAEDRIVGKRSIFDKIFYFIKDRAIKFSIYRDIIWNIGSWKSKYLYEWIEEFNPDVIFFYAGGAGFMHEISRHISKKYQIPLVIFFADDFVIYPFKDNNSFGKNRMYRLYKESISASKSAYVIGEKMAFEYGKLFHYDFKVMMNLTSYKPYIFKNANSESVIISYIGGLHLNRWKMINRFAKGINALNISKSVEIRVYSTTQIDSVVMQSFKENEIAFMGAVFNKALDYALYVSDFLLHIESDNEEDIKLTKLSVSTKIPEYLFSSSCLIGFGPNNVASMQLISDNNIGIFIDSLAPDFSMIQDLIENAEKRRLLSIVAHKYASEYFNAERQRNMLLNDIREILAAN